MDDTTRRGAAAASWRDDGPRSQGKILTAVLQDRQGDAARMLGRWSRHDLGYLIHALCQMESLARAELSRRAP